MSLKFEPSLEALHVSVKQFFAVSAPLEGLGCCTPSTQNPKFKTSNLKIESLTQVLKLWVAFAVSAPPEDGFADDEVQGYLAHQKHLPP